MSWMVDITGDESSSMIALTMAVGTLGPVILSVVTGIFSQIQGTQYLMAVPTVCFVLLFVMLIVFRNVKVNSKEL
jgi:fucose permease